MGTIYAEQASMFDDLRNKIAQFTEVVLPIYEAECDMRSPCAAGLVRADLELRFAQAVEQGNSSEIHRLYEELHGWDGLHKLWRKIHLSAEHVFCVPVLGSERAKLPTDEGRSYRAYAAARAIGVLLFAVMRHTSGEGQVEQHLHRAAKWAYCATHPSEGLRTREELLPYATSPALERTPPGKDVFERVRIQARLVEAT